MSGTSGPRRLTLPRGGRVQALLPAPVDAVWAVVSDVPRIGGWSHECSSAEWLGGARAPRPGARFRGRNRAGLVRWGRVNEVLLADAPRELVWRTLPRGLYRDSTRWRLRLEPVDGATRVVLEYQVLRLNPVLEKAYAVALPSHRDRLAALDDDLQRLGELAARAGQPTV